MSDLPKDATEFHTIEQYWNFKQLSEKLASHKIPKDPLSTKEEDLLRGFLLGYTPGQIAEKIHINARSISTARSKYLYPLLKALIQKEIKETEALQPDSPRTLILLEKMGYREKFMVPVKTCDSHNHRLSGFDNDPYPPDVAASTTSTHNVNSRV
jgi:hypothetical protein